MKSDKIYPLILRDDNTYTNPANIVVSDVPVMNPLQVVIKKVDAETGSEEGIGDGLEGAEFRLNFYGADTSVMHTSYELKNEYQNALKNEYSETVSTTKQSDGSYKAVLGAGKDFPLGL